jgi:uncharacterized protein (DUF1015 family)
MNKIKSISGYRFNPEKVDISKCIAPPYDVFNYGDTTDKALRSEAHNIVNIQKPVGEGDTKYESAKNIFQDFVANNILINENKEGHYILKQSWGDSSRLGIITSVLLDESYTRIKPHEKTKQGPIEDRLKLTKSTGLHIGSIFVVFDDSDNAVSDLIKDEMTKNEELYNFKFPGNINNEFYFTDSTKINELLEEKTLFIADGHHRYQTMINYRNYMREKLGAGSNDNRHEYAMMFLVPHSEITILPYHRFIKNFDEALLDSFIDKASENFLIQTVKGCYPDPPKGSFAYYYKDNYYVLTPKEPFNGIYVEAIHEKVLEPYFGLTEEKIKTSDCVHYISGENDNKTNLAQVDDGTYQAAFILDATSFEEIKSVSLQGRTMPRKSTYFYPKVPSGIVLYKAD